MKHYWNPTHNSVTIVPLNERSKEINIEEVTAMFKEAASQNKVVVNGENDLPVIKEG